MGQGHIIRLLCCGTRACQVRVLAGMGSRSTPIGSGNAHYRSLLLLIANTVLSPALALALAAGRSMKSKNCIAHKLPLACPTVGPLGV